MRTRLISLAAAAALAIPGCTSDTNDLMSNAAAATATTGSTATTEVGLTVQAGEPFPNERCAANEAAGTLTFLTGIEYTAASVIDVITASEAGYYTDLCLDVEIVPGSGASNYSEVASGTAQFASGGSFSEVVEFSAANDADLVAATVEGRTAIDTLILRSGEAAELGDLNGTSIGVSRELPPSIDVMLRGQGLVEGQNFETVALDESDLVTQIETNEIAGFPGSKSSEVGQLERAGIGVQLFDPLDFGVPGSFGTIFTSASFVADYPTAAEDFVRATAQGLADAVADPAVAAAGVLEVFDDSDEATRDAEIFRWETEAQLVLDGAHEGIGLGIPDALALQLELEAYGEVGLFGDATPEATDFIADGLAERVYDESAVVIWPS